MPRDLGPALHSLEIGKRVAAGAFDIAFDLQAPVLETAGAQDRVILAPLGIIGSPIRAGWVIGARGWHRGDLGAVIFARQPGWGKQRPLDVVGEVVAHPQDVAVGGRLPVAATG